MALDSSGFVGLEPVAYFVVVDGEIPEDFGGVQLQLGQKFFELGLIEEFALLDGPGVAKELFRSEGQAGDDHGGETEGFAFVDANIVGNGMGPIVVGGRGIDFGLQVAATAVFLAHAVPGGFDGHAIGDIAGFQSDGIRQSNRGEQVVAGPLGTFPVIDRTGIDGDIDGNFFRKLLVGIAG